MNDFLALEIEETLFDAIDCEDARASWDDLQALLPPDDKFTVSRNGKGRDTGTDTVCLVAEQILCLGWELEMARSSR